MTRYYLSVLALAVLTFNPALAAPPPAQTLQAATTVLDELAAIPLRGIPPALLADAQGVAIIPRVIKAGLIVGGRGGHGVLLVREPNGGWSEPTFIAFGGASIGIQAGVESTDVVLVFRTRNSLERLFEGKRKITLGADVAAAAGPVGRELAAATDARMKAEILSYSRSRGLFAGVAVDGGVITSDPSMNATFRRDVHPETAKLLETLKTHLTEMATVPVRVGPRRIIPFPSLFLEPAVSPIMPVGPMVPVSPLVPGVPVVPVRP
jgi:lipid-binding SYLF domain-containing protein